MSKDDRIIRSGPFKGKRITFASTDRVKEFKAISDDFMFEVFDLEPGDYVISDESDLLDFVSFAEEEAVGAWDRMQGRYALNRESLQSTRLIDVFAELSSRKRPQ